MKYRYNIAIVLALVFLVLLTPSFAPVSADWNRMDYGPTGTFIHQWTGTLLKNENGIETWQLYSEIMMMSASAMMSGSEWVKMTIEWDTSKHFGLITQFEHHGQNLMFIGGTGTIQESNSYSFEVLIEGTGTYKGYALHINGSYSGIYYEDDPQNPFVSGYSECTELATLFYFVPGAVGGEIIPVDNMAVFLPYLALFVLVSALSVTTAFVIKRRLLN